MLDASLLRRQLREDFFQSVGHIYLHGASTSEIGIRDGYYQYTLTCQLTRAILGRGAVLGSERIES